MVMILLTLSPQASPFRSVPGPKGGIMPLTGGTLRSGGGILVVAQKLAGKLAARLHRVGQEICQWGSDSGVPGRLGHAR